MSKDANVIKMYITEQNWFMDANDFLSVMNKYRQIAFIDTYRPRLYFESQKSFKMCKPVGKVWRLIMTA